MEFSAIVERLLSSWSVGFFSAWVFVAPLYFVDNLRKVAGSASLDFRGDYS